MTGMNADHSQSWCLLTGPAESKPNSRMIRAKTIGVMLMVVDHRQKIAAARMPSRTPSNGLQTANQKETFQLEVVEFIFTLFSQAFEDGHFTECEISFETLNEVRRIWIGASRLEDFYSSMDWLVFVRGRSFQRVGVLAVEHELTSLVMHRCPRGYDARVSLRCQLSDFELGI